MRTNHSGPRGVSYISLAGVIALLVLLSNGFIISALADEQSGQPATLDQTGPVTLSSPDRLSPHFIAQAQFTPTFTLHMPIILTSPPADPASCNPSGGSGGLEPGTYERKVGPLQTTIVVSSKYNPNKPTYFAFYLHGDDGDYTRFKDPNNRVTRFIEDQGWIFIAPQSSHPNIHWYKNADTQVEELDAVFQQMFADYNLCQNPILGATISGGSTFVSGHFFPERGQKYPLHVNLICLGWTDEDARQKIKALGQEPAVVDRSSFKFTYGDQDQFLSYIIPTIDVYKKAGFDVTVEEQAGVGHCPPIGPEMVEHWQELADSLALN